MHETTPKAFASGRLDKRRRDKRVGGKAGKRRTLNVQRPMSKSLTAKRSQAVAFSKHISESCRSQGK
jgi:hypothetical protein